MSSRVCVTGHIKDAVPLIEMGRAPYPGGRFDMTLAVAEALNPNNTKKLKLKPPSFINHYHRTE